MIAYPPCNCKNMLKGSVRVTLPDHWQRMDELRIEEAALVECMECRKIVKPPYTLYRNGRLVTPMMLMKRLT